MASFFSVIFVLSLCTFASSQSQNIFTKQTPYVLPSSITDVVAALHDPNGDIVYLLTQIDTTPINIVPARILRYNLDDWSLDSTLDLPNVVLDDTAVIDSRGENIYITDGDDITEINVATKSMSVGKTVSTSTLLGVSPGIYEGKDVLFIVDNFNITYVQIPFGGDNGLLLSGLHVSDVFYHNFDSTLYFSVRFNTTAYGLYSLNGPNNITSIMNISSSFRFVTGWNNNLFAVSGQYSRCFMLDINKKTNVIGNYSCENVVVTPRGPFFSNYRSSPLLLWPNVDFSGWIYSFAPSPFFSTVLILRNSTTTSVSLNTVQYTSLYSTTTGITQIDVITSPSQNLFEISNISTVYSFPRGLSQNIELATSVDQTNLIAVSYTSLLVKYSLVSPSSPSLIASSNLLGPAVAVGVTQKVIAVVVANNIYDRTNLLANYSIQLFDYTSLLPIQTIPLPISFNPASLSIANQTIIVGGSNQRSAALYYFNLQTNTFKYTEFPSTYSAYFSSIIVDKSETFAYASNSNGTLWQFRLPDFTILQTFVTGFGFGSINQIIVNRDGFIYLLNNQRLVSLSNSTFQPFVTTALFGGSGYIMSYDSRINVIFLASGSQIIVLNGESLQKIGEYDTDIEEPQLSNIIVAADTLYATGTYNAFYIYSYSFTYLTTTAFSTSTTSTTSSTSSNSSTTTSSTSLSSACAPFPLLIGAFLFFLIGSNFRN